MSKDPVVSIIDDDASVRASTVSLVRSLGLVAQDFASAEEFLRAAGWQEADCIITDVRMPGMSGVELQDHLRAQGSRLPIIFVTAFPDERLRARVEAAGAAGFFSKPCDSQVIIDCLHRALRGGEGLAAH